jgi:meso-butanediol dehydrogenase / (S,S)-butanediol dehydrogenase / diacetyl reductase
MTEGRYAGKVAVVTGAGSGIGRAIARRVVAEGGAVAAGDIVSDSVTALADEVGERCVPVTCDVTREEDVAALVAVAVDRFGGVHAGFNVAGGSRPGLIHELSEADWDWTIDLCLKGVFFAMKHQAAQMITQGSGGAIVNIASLNSRVPMFFGAAYCAAKAGVVALTQTGALEWGDHRIRVSAVSPGLTDTPLVQPLMELPAARQAYLDRIPLGRAATPEDIAASATFLASDDAAYISGVNLFVDGAWEQTAYPDLRPYIADLVEPT